MRLGQNRRHQIQDLFFYLSAFECRKRDSEFFGRGRVEINLVHDGIINQLLFQGFIQFFGFGQITPQFFGRETEFVFEQFVKNFFWQHIMLDHSITLSLYDSIFHPA